MGNKWAPIVSSVRCRWLGSPGEICFALESRKHCRRDCHRKVTDPVGLTRSRLGHGNGAGCVGAAGLSIWGAVLRAATQIAIIHCTSNVQRPTGCDARTRWGCFDLGLMTWCITYTGSMGKHRACQLPVKWTVALPGRSHDTHYSHRCVTLRVRLAQGAAWPCRKDGDLLA